MRTGELHQAGQLFLWARFSDGIQETQREMHHARGAWLLIGRNCVRACGKLSADVRPVEREA